VLGLTALPSIDAELWVPVVQETDVLLVNGGDPLYLCYWMRQSGLEDFVIWKPPTGGDETLRVVDFSIFPHLDHEDMPDNSMADAERWAARIPGPAYAIDDQTAIKVTNGNVEVVSEGHWRLFAP
jgi:dipeptidase E